MSFDPGLAKAIARIGRLQKTIEELALLPRAVATLAAPKLSKLVAKQFSSGSDPYGRPWRHISATTKRLRKGRKGGRPLTDTGRLRAGTGVSVTRSGCKLVLGAPYGYFHQVGTRNMPARRIFPQFGMPAAWRAVLQETARAEFRRRLRAS